MRVTVDVKGEDVHDLEVETGDTYADLLRAVDLHPQEASVLVDGRPVPDDAPIEDVQAEGGKVTVLRLIKGG